MEVSENFLKRQERLLRLHTNVPQEEFRHLVRLQLWCTEQCRCSNLKALPLRDIVRFLLMYTEVRNFVGMHSVVIDALLADINVRARVQSQDISLMIRTWFTGLFVCNSMDNIVEMLKHMAFPGYCLMLRLFERRESGRPIILPRFVHQSLWCWMPVLTNPKGFVAWWKRHRTAKWTAISWSMPVKLSPGKALFRPHNVVHSWYEHCCVRTKSSESSLGILSCHWCASLTSVPMWTACKCQIPMSD